MSGGHSAHPTGSPGKANPGRASQTGALGASKRPLGVQGEAEPDKPQRGLSRLNGLAKDGLR